MVSAHQANSFFWKSFNSIDNQGIRVIIMPGSGKKVKLTVSRLISRLKNRRERVAES